MISYSHFTPFERGRILELLKLGYSHLEIAKRLNRHRSSVDREIKRNSLNGIYDPQITESMYSLRQKSKNKFTKVDLFKETIKEHILLKWSPEQISNTILKEKVSFSSIYRWIYLNKIDGITFENLRHKGKLLKLKSDRRTLRFGHGKSVHKIPKNQRSREFFGHWELDTVLPSRGESKVCLATFAERKSRLYICLKIPNRTSESMYEAIKKIVSLCPKKVFNLITCDRGSEFLCSSKIEEELKIPVYFTDAFCAWQKGTNENSNGLLREFFPKKTNFEKITEEEIFEVINLLNNRPRKCLGWKTPKEVFEYEIAHLS